MQNTIKILVDLKKEIYRFDQAQQGDDVILDLTILENGVAKDLTGETVELIYINANNTIASVTGDKIVVSGNNVKITCPTDCTRSYGIAKFQLKIVSTYQVSTFPIALTIVPSVDQNQQISQNISTILEDLTAKNIECGETLENLENVIATADTTTYATQGQVTEINSHLADIASVKLNGAKGDGVNSDVEAFNKALEKEIVFLPSGTYNLLGQNISTNKAKLIIGNNATILGGFSIQSNNVIIDGVKMVGNDGSASIRLTATNVNNLTIRNCIFDRARLYLQSTVVGSPNICLRIINNDFIGDYSGAPDNCYPVYLQGIEDVIITNNYFNVTQADRIIKMTTTTNKSDSDCLDETDNLMRSIVISNNIIKGTVRNGGAIDMFNSGVKVVIANNHIKLYGVPTGCVVFKRDGDKGSFSTKNRELIIQGNTLESNAPQILRMWGGYDGVDESIELQQTVIIDGNIITKISSSATSDGVPLYIRGIDKSIITNNFVNYIIDNDAVSTVRIGYEGQPNKHVTFTGNVISKGAVEIIDTKRFIFSNNNIMDFGKFYGGIFFQTMTDAKGIISDNFFKTTATSNQSPNIGQGVIRFGTSSISFSELTMTNNISEVPNEISANNRLYLQGSAVVSKIINTDNSWNIDSGTALLRPTTALAIGQEYFDTTLNKKLSWNGTVWVDGTSRAVWSPSKAYVVGDVVNTDVNQYRCTVAGTTSTNLPTFTSGTATNGGVTWEFVKTIA